MAKKFVVEELVYSVRISITTLGALVSLPIIPDNASIIVCNGHGDASLLISGLSAKNAMKLMRRAIKEGDGNAVNEVVVWRLLHGRRVVIAGNVKSGHTVRGNWLRVGIGD